MDDLTTTMNLQILDIPIVSPIARRTGEMIMMNNQCRPHEGSSSSEAISHHQGTPNDVTQFPALSKSKSSSIPIATLQRSASEIELDEEEERAEFRSYQMYRRIVDGRRNSTSNKVIGIERRSVTNYPDSLENLVWEHGQYILPQRTTTPPIPASVMWSQVIPAVWGSEHVAAAVADVEHNSENDDIFELDL